MFTATEKPINKHKEALSATPSKTGNRVVRGLLSFATGSGIMLVDFLEKLWLWLPWESFPSGTSLFACDSLLGTS